MSTALYRRYRPEVFAEVIGQEHVTGPLSAALAKNRVSHAYLFSGPRGCGKTTSARILARCLNCEQGPTPTPCGVCDSCVALARGGPGSLDVIEIDAASHRGIDDAREIRDRAAFAPAASRFKVFIIDEAHMVTKEGFNALLKTVEEPPEHVKFVFATTEPDKVIGTIRSRTHHYPFRLVPPGTLQDYLNRLCAQEGVQVEPGVLPLVVRAGAGSVRDCLSVLDQLIAGSGESGLTYPLALSLLGYTDSTLLDEVVGALASGDGAAVFSVVDHVIESGHDPRRFVEDLLERMRDLLVVAAIPDGAYAVLRGLSEDQLGRMREQAAAYGRPGLSRAADVVNAALTEMTGATSPRLQLELLCARLLLPGADEGIRGLGARLDTLEKRFAAGVGPMAAPRQAPPGTGPRMRAAGSGPPPADAGPALEASPPGSGEEDWPAGRRPPAPVRPAESRTPASAAASAGPPSAGPPSSGVPAAGPAAAPVAGEAGADATARVRAAWPQVLAALGGIKRTTWSLLSQHAQVLDFDGARLVLGFSSAGLAQAFTRGAHGEFLRQAMIDSVGLDCRIEAVSAEAEPATAPRPVEPPSGTAWPEPATATATAAPQAEAAPSEPGQPAEAEVAPPGDPATPARPPTEARSTGPRSKAAARPRSQTRPKQAMGDVPPDEPPFDEPSPDDIDLADAHLVGAPVVEQMLGGRVIEERPE